MIDVYMCYHCLYTIDVSELKSSTCHAWPWQQGWNSLVPTRCNAVICHRLHLWVGCRGQVVTVLSSYARVQHGFKSWQGTWYFVLLTETNNAQQQAGFSMRMIRDKIVSQEKSLKLTKCLKFLYTDSVFSQNSKRLNLDKCLKNLMSDEEMSRSVISLLLPGAQQNQPMTCFNLIRNMYKVW